jgi:hypothetical protein
MKRYSILLAAALLLGSSASVFAAGCASPNCTALNGSQGYYAWVTPTKRVCVPCAPGA